MTTKTLTTLILAAALTGLLPLGAPAASFDWDSPHVAKVSEMLTLNSFHTTITNTGTTTSTYTVTMVKEVSANWGTSLCANGTCYPPHITTVSIPDVAPSASELLDVDITPIVDEGYGRLIVTVSTRDGANTISETLNFTLITSGLDVLLVDGDEATDHFDAYTGSVGNAGKSYGVWKRQEMGALSNEDLAPFDAVVWGRGSLTSADFPVLAYYIQHGGGFFLASESVAYDLCDPASPNYSASGKSWLNMITGVDYVTNDSGATAVAGLGDLVAGALSFDIDGSSLNGSPDVVTAVDAAQPSLEYTGGQLAGVYNAYNLGKTYFTGFDFAGIVDGTSRDALMDQVLAFFAGELVAVHDGLPALFASQPKATPNPFNPQTSIQYDVGGDKVVTATVDIYDIQGRLVRSLFHGDVTPGPQSLVWNGRNNAGQILATGVYLAQVRMADQAQTVKMTLAK